MPVEDQLCRPRVDAVGIPQREGVIDRDRPHDSLTTKVLRHIGALLLGRGFRRMNSNDGEAAPAVAAIEIAQFRNDVATIHTIDRKHVEHDHAAIEIAR